MRIGILTYHRAENYGALLQAYATMTYLRSLGHDVTFVDYWPKYHSDYFCLFSIGAFRNRNIKGKIAMLFRFVLWSIPKYIRKKRLQGFMHERLSLSKNPVYFDNECITDSYDTVVYGSDQIWRKQNLDNVLYDRWYFGSNNVRAKKKVVYAGSMGAVNMDAEEESYVIQQMNHFDVLSVREKDLQNFLFSRGIKAQLVCDPVFLLSKEEWEKVAMLPTNKKKYILFYNLLNSQESASFTNQLSSITGLPVVEINKKLTLSRFVSKRYVSCASVEQFLGLIRDAAYVVSNSFHGVAFSIIFEKEFFATGMGRKANRVISLLESAGISDRYINSSDVPANYDKPVPYDLVKGKIYVFKEMSMCYLNQSIR